MMFFEVKPLKNRDNMFISKLFMIKLNNAL